jgi:hypothetical protein
LRIIPRFIKIKKGIDYPGFFLTAKGAKDGAEIAERLSIPMSSGFPPLYVSREGAGGEFMGLAGGAENLFRVLISFA